MLKKAQLSILPWIIVFVSCSSIAKPMDLQMQTREFRKPMDI